MAYGLGEQIEDNRIGFDCKWGRFVKKHSDRYRRRIKSRRERRRARINPECAPEYKRFKGWEW